MKIITIYLVSLTFLIVNLAGCGQVDKPCPADEIKEFPESKFSYIVAYELRGYNENVIVDDRLSSNVKDDGIRLSKDQEIELLKIFSDDSTYGDCPTRCFNPSVGYVFYDDKNHVVAHSSVCLSCNWMSTFPDIGGGGFSIKGSMLLEKIEQEILNTSRN